MSIYRKPQNTAKSNKRRIIISARLVALVKSANRAGLVVLDKSAYCRPPVEG